MTTAKNTAYYSKDGFAYEIPFDYSFVWSKAMPCGHYGLWVKDRWVCQTCFSWQLEKIRTEVE